MGKLRPVWEGQLKKLGGKDVLTVGGTNSRCTGGGIRDKRENDLEKEFQ